MGLIELIMIEQVEIGYLMMKKKEENPLGRPSVEFGRKIEKLRKFDQSSKNLQTNDISKINIDNNKIFMIKENNL